MTNEVTIREKQMPTVQNSHQVVEENPSKDNVPFDAEQIGELIDEFISAAKDDRLNTKRAISADIASTARVQNQNGQVITACEKELRRRDLSEERREELFDIMSRMADSSAHEAERSREFQKEQLAHSRVQPWKIAAFIAVLAVGGAGGVALIRAVA